MCEAISHNEHLIERFIVQSKAVTLKKIKDGDWSLTTNKLIELIHQENLNLSVFKEIFKTSGDRQVITQKVIELCK